MSWLRRVPGWLVLLMACARSGPSAPAERSASGGAPTQAPGTAPVPSVPSPVPVPVPSAPEATRATPPAASANESSRSDATTGITDVAHPGPARVLHAVRSATAVGYDRVVFEFRDGVPGFHLEYVDRPIRDCGAGDVKPVEGDGWLEVRFFPASAHTEAGQPTVAERELLPRLPIVREIERTCDFEAVVTWVVGTASPNRYRAFELRDPPRLVIDIDH